MAHTNVFVLRTTINSVIDFTLYNSLNSAIDAAVKEIKDYFDGDDSSAKDDCIEKLESNFEGKYKNHIEQCLYSDTLGDSDGEMDMIEIWTQPVLP
jgi:hypothetical protein